MFDLRLLNLRRQGLKVGIGEWLTFLSGLQQGLAGNLDELYRFGRAVLTHTETQFDAWDVAFTATFEGVQLDPVLSEQLADWLQEAVEGNAPFVEHDLDPEELRRQFEERLKEQQERHDGGSRWVGTGGNSPFGRQGNASNGVQVGGGGNRSALRVAGERNWADYRADRAFSSRDFAVALRTLRNLAREGPEELDLDDTIDRTAKNAGDIDLSFRRARQNRVHLRLILDTGGSMTPHARLVEALFKAAQEEKGFKSFEALQFHNAPYGWLYRSYARNERVSIDELLRDWTPRHRLVFVGDASMAPYELFDPQGNGWGFATNNRGPRMSGLAWLQLLKGRCPAAVWLNPDPIRWWDHPTVRAIGGVFPMYPLSVSGLEDAVRTLRRAR